MLEGRFNEIKEESEYIPTQEEIRLILVELIEGSEYEEVRKLEDNKGVYLWEIIVIKKDGNIGYDYMRKGKYSEGQSTTTAINAVFYNEDGMPISGELLAEYDDMEGKWEIAS